jgi:hypothetical protein
MHAAVAVFREHRAVPKPLARDGAVELQEIKEVEPGQSAERSATSRSSSLPPTGSVVAQEQQEDDRSSSGDGDQNGSHKELLGPQSDVSSDFVVEIADDK